jgi:hypothetical protein
VAFPLYNKYRCIDVLTYISLDCMIGAQRERERERERELTDMEREEEGGR